MAIVGGALVFAWTPMEPDPDAVTSSGPGKAALS